MTEKLLTLPLRVGFGAARLSFDITARIVGAAIGIVRPGPESSGSSEPAPFSPAESRATQTPPRPASRPAPNPPARQTAPSTNGQSAAAAGHAQPAPAPPGAPARSAPPAPAVDVTPPAEQPDTPLTPSADAAKTVDDSPEVVATFAEPGAEDGVGAQLDVDEPWEGYDAMNASQVVAQINRSGAAELAVLELYEGSHKKRRTVLDAAARRLRSLSPPDIA